MGVLRQNRPAMASSRRESGGRMARGQKEDQNNRDESERKEAKAPRAKENNNIPH